MPWPPESWDYRCALPCQLIDGSVPGGNSLLIDPPVNMGDYGFLAEAHCSVPELLIKVPVWFSVKCFILSWAKPVIGLYALYFLKNLASVFLL